MITINLLLAAAALAATYTLIRTAWERMDEEHREHEQGEQRWRR